MKALSVKQPWALLILSGGKTVEIRSWRTDYRGELAICASRAPDDVWLKENKEAKPTLMPAGAVLGVVNLIDCRKSREEDEELAVCDIPKNSYSWVFDTTNAYTTRPDKITGKLRLFDIPDEKIIKLSPDDHWWNYPMPQGDKKPPKKVEFFE